MSLLSYIAFPRQIDISRVYTNIDKSKYVAFGEFKNTEKGKQFQETHAEINLPDTVPFYLGSFSDFYGIRIFDKQEAIFDGIFDNPFIYGFDAKFRFPAIINHEDVKLRAGFEGMNENSIKCRKQLYEVIREYITPNEKVELYSGWGYDLNFHYTEVEKQVTINLDEVLDSKELDLCDMLKTDIVRTV